MILDLDQYAVDHGTTTKEQLLFSLRQKCNCATEIIQLVTTEFHSSDPALARYIDTELSWSFDDLGNCFFDCWDGVRHALENGRELAEKPTTGDLQGRFAGFPAIVLGAGPGASVQWDAIKASRGRAVLIVCDVMLKPCLERGIIPDFVSAVERTPEVYESLKDTPTDGTILVGPAVLEKRVIDHFQGRVIWCWRYCGLEQWVDPEITRSNFGRSCGVQGISVALIAGCSPIYLVGHDLCMDGERTHAAEAQASTLDTTAKIHADVDEYHRRKPAKSISGRDVQTTHLWGMFKADIQHIIAEHPASIVVNTGDGLAIDGTYAGKMPDSWGNPIRLPVIARKKPGKDRENLVPVMLAEIPHIEKAMRAVMEMATPDSTCMRLSTMVSAETAQIWTEIYGGTYCGAALRIALQPGKPGDTEPWLKMLKRVANTVIHTLPIIKKGLHAIEVP